MSQGDMPTQARASLPNAAPEFPAHRPKTQFLSLPGPVAGVHTPGYGVAKGSCCKDVDEPWTMA